ETGVLDFGRLLHPVHALGHTRPEAVRITQRFFVLALVLVPIDARVGGKIGRCGVDVPGHVHGRRLLAVCSPPSVPHPSGAGFRPWSTWRRMPADCEYARELVAGSPSATRHLAQAVEGNMPRSIRAVPTGTLLQKRRRP